MMCYEVHLPIGCMPFLAVMARRDGARPAYEISDPPVAWSARIGQECGGSAAWLSEARFATSDIFTPALLAQAAFRAQSMRGGGLDHILKVGARQALAAWVAEGTSSAS